METNGPRGGTQLVMQRLFDGSVPRELLSKFQIVLSPLEELDAARRHIFYAHDLAEDPQYDGLADPAVRRRFDRFVFVSHWQMQEFNLRRGVPYQDSTVIKNSIEPMDVAQRQSSDAIRLIYHSTPHRGLDILVPAFLRLAQEQKDLELRVYSSFKIYGWEQGDAMHAATFDLCRNHPQIRCLGTVSNSDVRTALLSADVFAYPSIYRETSCLCLIEAMSAGLLCVHPNLAALPETAMGLTWMYQWQEDVRAHGEVFLAVLRQAVETLRRRRHAVAADLKLQKLQVDRIHGWKSRAAEWTALLETLNRRAAAS